MRFSLSDLAVPVIAAPMAGGPSTPQLAAAAANAGGMGFVPGALVSAEVLVSNFETARSLTTGPLGVNLFVPQPSAAQPDALDDYAAALAVEAERRGVELGEPGWDDDGWAAKLDVVLQLRPQVASFTFGLPSADHCRALRDAGIATAAMVTTVEDARQAVAVGVDILVAQGPSAGAHRGIFATEAQPSDQPLSELLAAVLAAVDVPVVAAGGLASAREVDQVIAAGAVAAQVGTALLLAHEAGTNPVHRAALQAPEFSETVVTRCFTGRYARGLRNRFTDSYAAIAPPGYPNVHHMTSPLRAASVAAGDPHGTHLWAGTEFGRAKAAPAAQIIEELSCR